MYTLLLVLIFADGSSTTDVVDTGLTRADCYSARSVILKDFTYRQIDVYDMQLYCTYSVNF